MFSGIKYRARAFTYLFRQPNPPSQSRFDYQKNYITHVFSKNDRVLDIGSGGDPFPAATILADRFLEPTRHRTDRFRTDDKPVVICDINALPFAASTFDYVICAHVLEHVDDPVLACKELQRVARAGFIETPTLAKDMLFSWAEGMHKWHIITIANRLIFFEYSTRLLKGMNSRNWYDLMFGQAYHPLQTDFNENQDIWNTMLEWKDAFNITVMRLDGSVEASDQNP